MKHRHASRKKVRSPLRHLSSPVVLGGSVLKDLILILSLAARNFGWMVAMLMFLLTVGALLDFMNPSLGVVGSLLEIVWDKREQLGAMAFIAGTFPLVWQFNAAKRDWGI